MTTTWRNHSTHAEETQAVKAALAAAGIPARVGHGKGTAWAWLEINVGPNNRDKADAALSIAKQVTGRDGDYDGGIIILSQSHFTTNRRR